MSKITLIGAGSAVFARQIITDILNVEGLDEGRFALVDIDPERLELAHKIAEKIIALSGKRWSVSASTERRALLPGSDYIVNSIEVAGLANVRHDYEIPLKYGIDQCIGDTIGPGGIFKALRTGPAWLDVLRDAERLCPHAWVLNYTNPMSILTLAALAGTTMQTVGLCHSVQGTSQQLARYLEVPYAELYCRCAGTNHNAWLTELRYHGNVRNTGLIDNLPDGCVEVACLVDRNGVQPCHFGPLPEQLAALNRSHMAVHALLIEALLNHDKQAARYALLLDPLTAAVLSPAEISALFDEMWQAERQYLQPFER